MKLSQNAEKIFAEKENLKWKEASLVKVCIELIRFRVCPWWTMYIAILCLSKCKPTPYKNFMRSKIYLHTEISIFFAFGFWINRRGKRFIKKINRSSKSVQRREYHQPVSFIWSFSLCYFPPFFRTKYLDFRFGQEYCRLLFIPRCNVLDQNQRTKQ